MRASPAKGKKRPALGLAGNLAHYRRERMLSQTALAALAGLSQTGVSKIERGDIADVRTRTVDRLARALSIATAHLTAVTEPALSEGRGALTPEEENLLTWFRPLRPAQKELVIEVARVVHRQQEREERDAAIDRDRPGPRSPDGKN